MYNLSSICFMCFNGNTTLKSVLQNDTATRVKYILPELTISDPVCICSLCCTTVNTFYTFKKTSIDNYNRLMKTANTLQATNEIQNQKISDFQIQTYNNCEPVVKQELDLDTEISIKEENEDLLVLREKQVEDPIFEDNIDINEEQFAAKAIIEPECYQQLEFVKCEIVSDSEQNGVTSEENNPLDKEDNIRYTVSTELLINSDTKTYKGVKSTLQSSQWPQNVIETGHNQDQFNTRHTINVIEDRKKERQRRYREQNREKLKKKEAERRNRLQRPQGPYISSNINRIELINKEITDANSQSSSGLEGTQTTSFQRNKSTKEKIALQKKRERQQRYREQNRFKLKQREAERRQRLQNSEMITESSTSSSNIEFIEIINKPIVDEMSISSRNVAGLEGM